MAGFYIYYVLCMPYLYLLIHCLGVCTYVCVLMCVYYSNCITIMSNICDSTDTSTCTYRVFSPVRERADNLSLMKKTLFLHSFYEITK